MSKRIATVSIIGRESHAGLSYNGFVWRHTRGYPTRLGMVTQKFSRVLNHRPSDLQWVYKLPPSMTGSKRMPSKTTEILGNLLYLFGYLYAYPVGKSQDYTLRIEIDNPDIVKFLRRISKHTLERFKISPPTGLVKGHLPMLEYIFGFLSAPTQPTPEFVYAQDMSPAFKIFHNALENMLSGSFADSGFSTPEQYIEVVHKTMKKTAERFGKLGMLNKEKAFTREASNVEKNLSWLRATCAVRVPHVDTTNVNEDMQHASSSSESLTHKPVSLKIDWEKGRKRLTKKRLALEESLGSINSAKKRAKGDTQNRTSGQEVSRKRQKRALTRYATRSLEPSEWSSESLFYSASDVECMVSDSEDDAEVAPTRARTALGADSDVAQL